MCQGKRAEIIHVYSAGQVTKICSNLNAFSTQFFLVEYWGMAVIQSQRYASVSGDLIILSWKKKTDPETV